MTDAALAGQPASVCDRQPSQASECEASEVAALLMRAGIDHASSLWFQLLELATQLACDWTERSAECFWPLTPSAAAVVGLRSLAADLLCTAPEQDEPARAAAEACLAACAEVEVRPAPSPPPRRWGEGAVQPPPPRPTLLDGGAGCC